MLQCLQNQFLTVLQAYNWDGWLLVKRTTGGQLFTAIGLDGNNSLLHLVYAVVEGQNKSSWKWFIELLKEDIGFTNSYCQTFITDKHKGLVPAIVELYKNFEHRCCITHLYNNFKLKHKGLALKDQLYAAARATTVAEFDEQMKELKKIDKDASAFFDGKPPTQLSKSHFNTYLKTDMLP